MTGDFRVAYLEEARKCLRASNKIITKLPRGWYEEPVFWANLLGAIANASVASVSNDVAARLLDGERHRREENERVRALLEEKLGK